MAMASAPVPITATQTAQAAQAAQSKLHEKRLDQDHLDDMFYGLKKYETRPLCKVKKIKIGDIIKFISKDDPAQFIIVVVVSITQYKTFLEMLEAVGLENVLPGKQTIEDGLKVYLKPDGYYTKEEEKTGVVAMELEVVKTI